MWRECLAYCDSENVPICSSQDPSSTQPRPGRPCLLSFTYNNITYNGCLKDRDSEHKAWCPTVTDKDGIPIKWDKCMTNCPKVDPKAPACMTVDDGGPCVFPYRYNNTGWGIQWSIATLLLINIFTSFTVYNHCIKRSQDQDFLECPSIEHEHWRRRDFILDPKENIPDNPGFWKRCRPTEKSPNETSIKFSSMYPLMGGVGGGLILLLLIIGVIAFCVYRKRKQTTYAPTQHQNDTNGEHQDEQVEENHYDLYEELHEMKETREKFGLIWTTDL